MSPAARRQAAQEIAAQFEAFRATGLPLDHVNAHRHFHLHPVVAAAIMRIGRRYGMAALRVPVEPWRIVAAIDPQTSRQIGRVDEPVGLMAAAARPPRRVDHRRRRLRVGLVGRDDGNASRRHPWPAPAGHCGNLSAPRRAEQFRRRRAGLSLRRGIRRSLRCGLHRRGAALGLRAGRVCGRTSTIVGSWRAKRRRRDARAKLPGASFRPDEAGSLSVSACRPDNRRRGTNRSRRRAPAGRAARGSRDRARPWPR